MQSFVVMGGCNTLVPQVLMALRSAGDFRCTVLGGPNTRKLRFSALCKDMVEIDFERPDDEQLLRQLKRIAEREPHATLVPVDCASMRMISRVREELPFRTIPLPDVELMDMFDDKWRFFQFCKAHGLSVPETLYIGRKEDLDYGRIAARLGVPFILKPSNEAGSTGVQVIQGEDDLRRLLDDADYRYRTLVAQRYVAGTDVCIDLFALRGTIRALALRRREGAKMCFFDNEQMRMLAHRIVAASAYNGVMNLDARIEHDSGRVYLIESNPRYWATLTASVGAGLNFVAHSISPPAEDAPMSMLTQGEFLTRHPLTSPSAWLPMLFDQGAHGRLLRAKMADMQGLRLAVKSLAVKSLRVLPQLFTRARAKELYTIQRR